VNDQWFRLLRLLFSRRTRATERLDSTNLRFRSSTGLGATRTRSVGLPVKRPTRVRGGCLHEIAKISPRLRSGRLRPRHSRGRLHRPSHISAGRAGVSLLDDEHPNSNPLRATVPTTRAEQNLLVRQRGARGAHPARSNPVRSDVGHGPPVSFPRTFFEVVPLAFRTRKRMPLEGREPPVRRSNRTATPFRRAPISFR
jgi:hypothetical protein